MTTLRWVGALLLAGCAERVEPAEPVWGKEPCAHCMMLLSEKAPAAQMLLEGGQRKYFDDVGCMVLFADHERATPRASWVHAGEGWKAASEARYAKARTPMDFGFVAASDGLTFEQMSGEVRRTAMTRGEVMP